MSEGYSHLLHQFLDSTQKVCLVLGPTEPTESTRQAASLTQATVAKATLGLIVSAYLATGRDSPCSSLNILQCLEQPGLGAEAKVPLITANMVTI